MPYRKVLQSGSERIESLAPHLPHNSLVTVRQKVAWIDGESFFQCGKEFVHHVRDLTARGRKVLLTFDGYRSHMTLRVPQLFCDNGIVVYALPVHTSGKTQPLYVSLFGAFKRKLNEIIGECCMGEK